MFQRSVGNVRQYVFIVTSSVDVECSGNIFWSHSTARQSKMITDVIDKYVQIVENYVMMIDQGQSEDEPQKQSEIK